MNILHCLESNLFMFCLSVPSDICSLTCLNKTSSLYKGYWTSQSVKNILGVCSGSDVDHSCVRIWYESKHNTDTTTCQETFQCLTITIQIMKIIKLNKATEGRTALFHGPTTTNLSWFWSSWGSNHLVKWSPPLPPTLSWVLSDQFCII